MLDGFSLAAKWMGWQTVFVVERDELRRKCLKELYPDAEQFDDAKKFDGTPYRGAIDVVTFGDPCQPSSTAGRRLGAIDPRYLWPEGFRIVREIQPYAVVNENVAGTISNGVLDQKISDLESVGYSCWPPLLIPANAAGAIHERERVFLVAYAERFRLPRQGKREQPVCTAQDHFEEANWILDAVEEKRLPLLCTKHDGLPARICEAINWGAGDSIVPAIAYEIFRAISTTTNRKKD
jgi:DNA (cytosine-5)-methyltransferase 1